MKLNWLNIPLGVVSVAVAVGLPLWTIIQLPDVGGAGPRACEESRPGSGRGSRSCNQVVPVVELASPMRATGGAS